MAEEPIEPYYQKQAKELVDWLFDESILSPNLTRTNLAFLDDFIGFLFQSNAKMAGKCALATERMKQRKPEPNREAQ